MNLLSSNLKVGVAWADVTHRVDRMTVLSLCGQEPMLERCRDSCTMGVDVGQQLHVVISRRLHRKSEMHQVVYIGVHEDFRDLDALMERFNVCLCVIDAQPEQRLAREFADRHYGRVYLNFFIESQKGAAHWDRTQRLLKENRTEALDLSRRVIRDKQVVLPRRGAMVEQFADHMAANAKKLEEDEDTGEQRYTYVRSGADHFSMAFTYNVLAWERDNPRYVSFGDDEDALTGEGGNWMPFGAFLSRFC